MLVFYEKKRYSFKVRIFTQKNLTETQVAIQFMVTK